MDQYTSEVAGGQVALRLPHWPNNVISRIITRVETTRRGKTR